jgi:FMNH2-dependent dimethyl sulfone monooxygenase
MKLGIWLPIFGGWLRNRDDEGMSADFQYNQQVAQLADRLGFSTILVAELNLNDIKGREEPTLEAWSTAAALAATTENIRLMTAIRPGYRLPSIVAKTAANCDQIANGRFEINLVSAWWREEMEMYTGEWLEHSTRYQRSTEFLDILKGMWRDDGFSYNGQFYAVKDTVMQPKPVQRPGVPIYAGGESDQGREMIASRCDGYLMHGDELGVIRGSIDDMRQRRAKYSQQPLTFGMAAYMICRDTEAEAEAERQAITNVSQSAKAQHSYDDFVKQSQLRTEISLEDYSVSNRGLRPGLVGTPEQILAKLGQYEQAGVELVLIQCSPMLEELNIIGEKILPQLS